MTCQDVHRSSFIIRTSSVPNTFVPKPYANSAVEKIGAHEFNCYECLQPSKYSHWIYIIAGFAVIGSYALLLMISIRYIKVATIPVIILVFIGALWCKQSLSKGRLQLHYGYNGCMARKSEVQFGMVVMVLLTYLLQLMQLMHLRYGIFGLEYYSASGAQQDNGSFIISHFLVFFSSAFGALAVMMSTLVTVGTSSPGAAQVLVLRVLRRTFTAIFLMAVHTMATEWIGEDMLLVCMPELVAVFAWFTLQFDRGAGCSTVFVNNVAQLKSSVIILSAAVALVACLTSVFSSENKEILKIWYTRAVCSTTLSGVLSYFSVWMIHQWSESSNNRSARAPIQLLKFSAKICFAISAGILVLSQVTLRFSVTVSAKGWSIWLGQSAHDGLTVGLYLAATCAVLYVLCLYRSLLRSIIKNIRPRGDQNTGTAEIKILVVSSMLVMVWQSVLPEMHVLIRWYLSAILMLGIIVSLNIRWIGLTTKTPTFIHDIFIDTLHKVMT